MLPKEILTILFLSTAILRVYGDLPSCGRAKCYHCKNSFISRKCPDTCQSCPKRYVYPVLKESRKSRRPTFVSAAKLTREDLEDKGSHVLRPLSQTDLSRANIPTQAAVHSQVQQIQPKLTQQPVAPEWIPLLRAQEPQTIQFNLKAVNDNQEFAAQHHQQQQTLVQRIVQQPPAQLSPPTVSGNQYQFNLPQLTLPQQPTRGFQQANSIAASSLPQLPQSGQQLQSPALNPFQPFLTNTFNALPGANFSPFFPNSYTIFPIGTFPPVTLAPVQATANQQPQTVYQTAQQSQYIQIPINEGHPSVNPRQQSQPIILNQPKQPIQTIQQPYQIITPEGIQNPQNLLNTPTQQIQQVYQNIPKLPSTQTVYSKDQKTQLSSPASIKQVSVPKTLENLQKQLPEKPIVQPSIDAPSINIQKSIYEGIKPPKLPQCPDQPKWKPCISKQLANERFHNCCLRLGEGCSSLCSYDATLTTIQLSVLTGRCPLSKVADMMVCASGNEDATPCCQAHSVFEPGFEHCKPYCNPSAGLPDGGLLTEKYKCLGKLSQIQHCFYITQKP